ncbi:hypothetical protein G3T36_07730 [Diaminobutyricibacter tongyongensis]|uniref:Uncharacterized protein n=1 Tax=Leifsonia tongyongensis TaxID=1268043 RepID=A0A6L9XWE4_9MICO|nr:hypothetical protein [Diaminobutyricibacter tongyongensis]
MVEFLRKLIEGDNLWGTLDVSPAGRALWRRVRLTVYPPGTTSAERRSLHFAHTWPIGGAILGLLLMVTLGSAWPPAVVVVVVAALYAAGFWLGARLTRPLRNRIRSLVVVSVFVGGGLEEYGDALLLRETTARLRDLDARRREGGIDPARYEAEWAEIYDTLPTGRTTVQV